MLTFPFFVELNSYWDLHRWSIENLEAFWKEILIEGGIRGSFEGGNEAVLHPADAKMDEFPCWFPGFKMNFAENLLFPAAEVDPNSVVINFRSEIAELSADWTWSHLRQEVKRLQGALLAFGVQPGDRIAAYCANCPEVLVFMLAGASIGAIFTAASPDFGPSAVIDRFGQTEPRVLLTCNAVFYNGRVHDHNGKVKEVLAACSFIEKVISLNYIFSHESLVVEDRPCIAYTEIEDSSNATLAFTAPKFTPLSFNHALYILYSSGTTGKPKCITHSAGGCLLQHCKEHWLHGALDASSCLLQYTTIGWMMWQWQVSALQRGTRIVLFDGSPFKPTTDRLLELIDELGVTHFGTSAKYLTHLQETATALIIEHSLLSLKTIFSTGSPLPETAFRFLHDWLPEVQVASITGGTDIVSLFAGGCPLLPVHAGEVQCPCLGMAIEARNEQNQPCSEGDLVCVRPFPCQPLQFWGDDSSHSRYHSAYFSHFPHIWHHGDFIRISGQSGGLTMLGRSDGTLNPAGVRFGSADLYAICAQFSEEIEDALAVGVRRPKWTDEQVYLFLKLKSSVIDDDLKDKLVTRIKSQLSPRHVPAQIMACPGIPHTLNGKKVEVTVKRILSGSTEESAVNLLDPQILEFYRQIGRDLALSENSKL